MAPTVVLDDVSAGRQRREKGVLVVSRQGLNQRHGFRAHLTVLTQKKKQSVEKESSAERAATAVPEMNLNFMYLEGGCMIVYQSPAPRGTFEKSMVLCRKR